LRAMQPFVKDQNIMTVSGEPVFPSAISVATYPTSRTARVHDFRGVEQPGSSSGS
jgi:hypothetical protein